MNQNDFQQLAEVRIDEAAVLLAHGKYDGAYYLAGYAVECGLKACIAKLSNQFDFPPKPKFINDYYSHEYRKVGYNRRLDEPAERRRRCRSRPASQLGIRQGMERGEPVRAQDSD